MSNPPRSRSRLPQKSVFFEKIVPASLVMLGVVMVVLVLFALGVLAGLIQF